MQSIGKNSIEEKGAEFLFQALKQNKTIASLDLSNSYTNIQFIASNNIGEKGAEFLSQALIQNNSITSLNIGILYINN
jgi:hypothetical protein